MFPRLRLRDEVAALLDLPWERPLRQWDDIGHRFRELPVGPSRHLVRFLVSDGIVYALKELPSSVAEKEFAVLRHLEDAGLPAVRAVGLAERPERGDAILVTEYLRHSMQYRRLLMRFRVASPGDRDRLLDAMALLLVDLHRGGVYWGDCSLSNTLFRRDGDRIQAYLVDAETSEVHPSLSDGQRRFDLEVLVENVAFGLADLAAYQGRDEDMDNAIEAAESVRTRYAAVWRELHDQPELIPGDRRAIRARLRRLNDLGFSVDLEVDPVGPTGRSGCGPPLPRAATTRTSWSGGRGFAPSRARPGSWSTISTSSRRGWSSTSRASWPPRRPRSAGCARSTGRPRRGSRRAWARTGTSSRSTATSSSTSGCCPSRPVTTSVSGRRSSRTWPRGDRPRSPRKRRRMGCSARWTWRPTTSATRGRRASGSPADRPSG